MQSLPIKIGLSACLAGENVRFDGGHRQDIGLLQALGKCFTFVKFCPEVAIGLSVPRQPIRLVRNKDEIRAVGTRDSSLDVTSKLESLAEHHKHWIEQCSGYIVKKGSPSCGLERVKVYESKHVQASGQGLFTRQISEMFPLMPIEEEGRLKNPRLMDSFVQRVYAYNRWRNMKTSGLTAHQLIQFHTSYKMILLSRNQQNYRALGRMVASVNRRNLAEISEKYITLFMQTLKQQATRASHVNVLQHLQGFLKHKLEKTEKEQLSFLVNKYANGELPLIAPKVLLKSYFEKHPHKFIDSSLYLKPYPIELGIYNNL